MYRPTVRYDDEFKKYVDSLFHSTKLDRNQIMRLGLFLLGHTNEGKQILNEYKRGTSLLPSPTWQPHDYGLWMEQTWDKSKIKKEGRHEGEGRQGAIRKIKSDSGGIVIKIG